MSSRRGSQVKAVRSCDTKWYKHSKCGIHLLDILLAFKINADCCSMQSKTSHRVMTCVYIQVLLCKQRRVCEDARIYYKLYRRVYDKVSLHNTGLYTAVYPGWIRDGC